ncbi:MAG: hypothetical protein D6785_04675 [Planctomycetota bacterium]|nr:MAG: hypothetical protein D6785_04675 [Planctomycetota bacterium]
MLERRAILLSRCFLGANTMSSFFKQAFQELHSFSWIGTGVVLFLFLFFLLLLFYVFTLSPKEIEKRSHLPLED